MLWTTEFQFESTHWTPYKHLQVEWKIVDFFKANKYTTKAEKKLTFGNRWHFSDEITMTCSNLAACGFSS